MEEKIASIPNTEAKLLEIYQTIIDMKSSLPDNSTSIETLL
tara:strand:+ start:271 stop:393 length:123 start_codon:yes stop_codon:yes gene_type:complete